MLQGCITAKPQPCHPMLPRNPTLALQVRSMHRIPAESARFHIPLKLTKG